MKWIFIIFLLVSCNVLKTLTDGETDPGDNFYNTDNGNCDNCDGNHDVVNLSNGLVSFYRLDETTATRIDSGFQANDLTDYAATITSINIASRSGMNCSVYGSATDYVYKSSGVSGMSFGNNSNFSISFWMYRLSSPASDMYILKTDDLEILSPNWDNAAIQVKVGGLQTSALIGAGVTNWHHVVINYDRDNGFYVYHNGSLFNHDGTSTTGENIATTFLNICSFTGGTNQFDGYLDSFGVWDRLLNESEIQALYNGSNNLD